jgi:hypothetical protein
VASVVAAAAAAVVASVAAAAAVVVAAAVAVAADDASRAGRPDAKWLHEDPSAEVSENANGLAWRSRSRKCFAAKRPSSAAARLAQTNQVE